MRQMKLLTGAVVLVVVASGYAFESEFDKRYEAWRAWRAANRFKSTYTACTEYYDIIALGVPALPLMIKKMEERFDDFHLSTAVGVVSKRVFGVEEWPKDCLGDSITASKMYVNWWRIGRFQTENRFKELYGRWCKLNAENKRVEAARVYRQIVNLGLPVLPCLVGVVTEHSEFVAAVSELTDGALPKTANPEECREWWAKNKERFTLPPLTPAEENSDQSANVGDSKVVASPSRVANGAATNATVRCEFESCK